MRGKLILIDAGAATDAGAVDAVLGAVAAALGADRRFRLPASAQGEVESKGEAEAALLAAGVNVVRPRAAGEDAGDDETEIIALTAPGCPPPPGARAAVALGPDAAGKLRDALLGAARLPLRLARAPIEIWREPLCALHRDNPVVAAARLEDATLVEIIGDGRSARATLVLTEDERLVARDAAALSPLAFERLGMAPGADVIVVRSPSPASRAVLRKKVGGGALTADEIGLAVRDLVEGRYSPAETAGFLVAASMNLGFDEIVALTRVRAEHMERAVWNAERVVDKHSMGGIPGNRITPIVASIVAAHGLLFPKTSSRAITSAAGTADTMEAIARVDLTRAEMRAAVERAGACVVWNGRISHSPVDDVMNAINRPLGVSSRLLDVSSILSKKLAAGASHVLIDIPVGPAAKLRDPEEARAFADLFEAVGNAVGLTVSARLTDGAGPIGRGVGPALELRDVRAVLAGSPEAPADLRAKALEFAATLIGWDPARAAGANHHARAAELLDSGAALEAMERIIDAQGRQPAPVEPGVFVHEIVAPSAGRLAAFDTFVVGGVARAAGAPGDKRAGVDLLADLGADLRAGQPVLRIHAGSEDALGRAIEEARLAPAFRLER